MYNYCIVETPAGVGTGQAKFRQERLVLGDILAEAGIYLRYIEKTVAAIQNVGRKQRNIRLILKFCCASV